MLTRTVYRKTLRQKLQSYRYAIPQNLNLRLVNPTMTITYSIALVSPHVSTNLLHVACNDACNCVHVVAPGARPHQCLGDVLATKIHQHYQCDECFNDRLHPHICFAKVNLQDSIQDWLNGSFKATQK